MTITKLGHACIFVEEGGVRFLIDPGSYNPTPMQENIDAMLITHEHQDHFNLDMVKEVLTRNPEAQILTVSDVAQKLTEAGIESKILEEGESISIKGLEIKRYGKKHALIYGDMPSCENAAFMIGGRLYHPGDSLFVPGVPVEILALPVAGPWMKLAECIDFAKAVQPKEVFPIHDGMLHPERAGSTRMFTKLFFEPAGIAFRDMQDGSVETF